MQQARALCRVLNVLEAFQQNLHALCPDWRDKRFIVAFSGGLDSTALLRLMSMSLPGGHLAAAHLNHLIRAEAANDQIFAARTCQELGLHFITESLNVPSLAQSRRRGLEEAARFARYEFFRRAVQSWPADFVVTAHQADDQAETILMHLIKGTGGGGLAGIPPRRSFRIRADESRPAAEILRPLLPFSRTRLQAWLREHSFPWVTDESNNDDHYLRNAIRLDVLPRLKELNPRILEAIGRASSIMRNEEEFWEARLAALWRDMVDEPADGPRLSIERQKLETLTIAEKRRLIYEFFTKIRAYRPGLPEPLSLAGVDTVLAMLAQDRHRGLDLPGGLRAELEPKRLILSLASRFR